jgi:signal transduction histidine kinase
MPTTWLSDRVRVVRDWWRGYDVVARDRWIAAVFTVLAFVPPLAHLSAQFGDVPGRPGDAFSFVLVLAQTVPLAVRSRWPVACLAVVGTSFAVHEALGYPHEFGTVTVYLALYSVGAHQARFRRATALLASIAYLGFCAAVLVCGSPDGAVDFVLWYLLFVAFWGLGAFVRRQRAEEANRRRLATEAAAAAERARIARELHDVVTHHVTAIVVQADATRYVADSPERVGAALTTIGGTGRRALSELRYLLDVLEATGESTPRPPVERTVRELVERTRQAGQPVDLVQPADGGPALPDGVGLAVYRVVQEGLTNAVKYAAGQPTEVRVGYRDGRVEVEVTNAADPAGAPAGGARHELSGGRGLVGLRERVGKLGGELAAGRRQDGGFRLRAAIPIAEDS